LRTGEFDISTGSSIRADSEFHACTPRTNLERRNQAAPIMSIQNRKVSGGRPEIWIGTLEVYGCSESGNQILGDADGAFVNVLTWAADFGQFQAKAKELMQYLQLRVSAIESAGPLALRRASNPLDEEIGRIADEVRTNPDSIRFCTFHTWKSSQQDKPL
jgi:hypothetical protein